MNTISIKSGSIIIPFEDIDIELGGVIYRNLVVIARLLNSVEIQRILRMDIQKEYVKEELYEDIFKSCILSIPGIINDIDFDNAPAGFITTVSSTILIKSLEYANDPVKYFNKEKESVTLFENMAAIVSRFMNINYLDVIELPVNKMFELYAVCNSTYPDQVKEVEIEESNKAD